MGEETSGGSKLRLRDVAGAFGLAAAHGTFLYWKVFFDNYLFHDNWRQSPHWINPARAAFHPDDVLVRYAEFNTSPGENLLYKFLATLGPDILWGKINGVIFYAIGAAIVFATGHAMRGRFGGWAATCMFMFFGPNFETFAGGFSSGMSMPLLCLAMLFVHQRRWWPFVPLIAAQVYIYPMVAVHTGAYLIADTLAHDLRRWNDPTLWKKKILPLGIAAGVLGLALFAKYTTDHDYGHLTDRVEIGDRVEFGFSGRARVVPVSSFTKHLDRQWTELFHVALFTAAFIYFGRRMLKMPRGLWSLLLASAVMFWLADLMLFRLYIPNRYVLRSLPLIMVFAGAYWMSGIRDRASAPIADWHPRLRFLGKTPQWVAVALVLAAIGVQSFWKHLVPPGAPVNSFRRYGIYEAVRALPGRPMIAMHPQKSSEIPLLAGKSVLITKEFAHPWWTDYWDLQLERHHDFFRAYFSDVPRDVRAATIKHNIDYWLVDQEDFNRGRWKPGRKYNQPFDSWISRKLRPRGVSVLATLPEELKLWADDRYFLVASPDLFAYLDRIEERR